MYQIKTLNAISSAVRDYLTPDRYAVEDGAAHPDAILVRSAKCHDLVFNPELKAIARAGAGVNNVPIDRCTEAGVAVFNTPGANANAVKELVFAAMLSCTRNLTDAIDWCKTLKGKGDEVPALVEAGKKRFVGGELRGKTLGVIGLGAIGVMVANDGHQYGMNVLGYDPYVSVENAWGLSRAVERALSLEDLLSRSDYVSLHIPLMAATRGMFSEKLVPYIKAGSVLANFSRAEIVDKEAVLFALESGRLRQYIVDFPTDDMIGVPGVVCIPHLGASTPESEENCARMAAAQLKDYLENGNIKNSVNLPACDLARSGSMRLCIINKNTPNMIGQFTALLSSHGANITNMINKSRGSIAYTIIDIDEPVEGLSADIADIDGVVRVSVL